LLFIIQILFVSFASNTFCSVNTKLKTPKDAREATSVIYEQNWETVYNAVEFVLCHSEYDGVEYGDFLIDSAEEEKAIHFVSATMEGYGVEIFFEPLSNDQVKVDFVKKGIINNPAIDALIQELPYLLEHGQQAYLEYTHNLALKRERER
jgi:hypothetical protein